MSVSKATERNWRRLQPDLSGKLKHGANKSRSEKQIRPAEYYSYPENAAVIERFISRCTKQKIPREVIIYSAAISLLDRKGILHRTHVQRFLAQYAYSSDELVLMQKLPEHERDLLGILYQTLLTEGEKNRQGAYYTPQQTAAEMMTGVSFAKGELFLDPCCGSGSFFWEAFPCSPEQLWGCDKDPLAVFIAGINLLLKYPDQSFVPHVFCCDYLGKNPLSQKKFDYIVSNPPWGGEKKSRASEDSFALFFRKAFQQLKRGGKICFLFPESVLNVQTHRTLRKMLLTETRLKQIVLYNRNFSGVMTEAVSIEAENASPDEYFIIRKGQELFRKNIRRIMFSKELIISLFAEKDTSLLQAIAEKGKYNLSESVFALGIVTGNNRDFIRSEPETGTEEVYTGKEVNYYVLAPSRCFLHYDRTRFQQVAREEYYRAGEKLIYRFISRIPVFAYDDRKVLCLNSANILIPKIPGMSIKTVLAFLNSMVLRYYYCHLSGGLKVLKKNLLQLPFPAISAEIDRKITALTNLVLAGKTEAERQIQDLIFQCYDLTSEQIRQIGKAECNGKG